ncbi:CE1759 family FMN reductase [Amycolatopsis sp. NPDC004772]
MTEKTPATPIRVVVISAGVSDPSTTRMLAERTTAAVLDRLRTGDGPVTASFVDLAALAADIGRSIVSADPVAAVQDAIEQVGTADGLIVATPVYKAGISGLFKSFVDLLDNDLIVAKPVILTATAGTARHAMVVDEQLRPLFAFLRAMPVPTSLFAAPEDWADPALTKRIERAAVEFAALVRARVADTIADAAWKGYQHNFNGNATRAEKTADDLDFDTRLMRLAAGGRSLVDVGP